MPSTPCHFSAAIVLEALRLVVGETWHHQFAKQSFSDHRPEASKSPEAHGVC